MDSRLRKNDRTFFSPKIVIPAKAGIHKNLHLSDSMKLHKFLFIIVTAVSGFLLLHHRLNYLPLLSQGDHGRDLYAFAATLNGDLPYIDYWWVYGPLMPYYYAGVFKILGISAQSALWGQFFLQIIAGIFFFLSLSLYIPALVAYAATLWFWLFQLEFFFTFNHAGGITVLMAFTYCLFLYIQNQRMRYLNWALLCIFLLALIKINFGLTALIMTVCGVFIIDKTNRFPMTPAKRSFYFKSLILLPLIILGIYMLFARGLSIYELRQCFPYLKEDHPYHMPLSETMKIWTTAIYQNIIINWPNRLFALLLNLCIVITGYQILKGNIKNPLRQQLILAIVYLIAFYALNLHEFLEGGVLYRTFWSQPFSILLIFLIIGFTLRNQHYLIRVLLVITLFAIIYQRFSYQVSVVNSKKLPDQFLALERGSIITGNHPQWFDTVNQTTQYLRTNLKDDELFFALPYDPIYYFLAMKKTPTRQLIFFEHINIPEQQEREIIIDLEDKSVNYVVLSSRAFSSEEGLGFLGQTYCPVLGEYIFKNFEPAATFGDWDHPSGWAWNHGTKILKRKHALLKNSL